VTVGIADDASSGDLTASSLVHDSPYPRAAGDELWRVRARDPSMAGDRPEHVTRNG